MLGEERIDDMKHLAQLSVWGWDIPSDSGKTIIQLG